MTGALFAAFLPQSCDVCSGFQKWNSCPLPPALNLQDQKLGPEVMEGSQSSVGLSTETLDRGMAILQGIADHGVVKQELPEDEREILCQIEAPNVVTHQAYIYVLYF